MPSSTAALLLTLALGATPAPAQRSARVYECRLERELFARRENGWMPMALDPASAEQKATLERVAGASSTRVDQSVVPWGEREVLVLVGRRAGGEYVVLIDTDLDGRFTDSDAARVHPLRVGSDLVWSARVDMPVTNAAFGTFPVRLALEAGPGGESALLVQNRACARGVLDVDGCRVNVELAVEPASGNVYPLRTVLGIDRNLDGQISDAVEDAERVTIVDRPRVVNVAGRSVELTAYRPERNSAEFTDRGPESELAGPVDLGTWQFVDLAGKQRSLAEHRGRVVLVVFWASWCSPCVNELPDLNRIARRYEADGLVLVGVSGDETNAKALAAAKRYGVAWPQAAPIPSGEALRDRLSVSTWPTHILLGRDGRVLTNAEAELRGDALEETLRRALYSPARDGRPTVQVPGKRE